MQVTIAVYPLEAANQALADLKHSLMNGEAVLQIAGIFIDLKPGNI